MRAVTTIDKAEGVLINWIKSCDLDALCAIFDYVFGTKSDYNPENEEFIIESGSEDEYGGIIEQEFKEDMKHL